jgi:hypothetical protein
MAMPTNLRSASGQYYATRAQELVAPVNDLIMEAQRWPETIEIAAARHARRGRLTIVRRPVGTLPLSPDTGTGDSPIEALDRPPLERAGESQGTTAALLPTGRAGA